MKEDILKCKSRTEACRLLNIPPNGQGMKKIEKILGEYGLTVDIFKKNKKYCKKCGLEIKPHKKFCNNSCAASFNNKFKIITEEHKNKTRSSLIKWNEENKKEKITKENKKCQRCNTDFKLEKIKNGRLSKRKYCSDNCSFLSMVDNCSIIQKKKVENGTHKGWQSRKILSYPEKFFINTFKNLGIYEKCETNFLIKKRDLGIEDNSSYFLDFYFKDVNLDLEIDGKQHEYEERKMSDTERDMLLTKNGIIVYRIKWVSINTERGKEYIKNEIDNFLTFYYKLQLTGQQI